MIPAWRARLERNLYPLAKLIVLLLLPLLFMFLVVPTGFLLESPGPSFDLQQDLTVRGTETYTSDGEFLLTAVSLQESRLLYHLIALFDDNYDLITARDYLGSDLDTGEQETVDEVVTILSQDTAVVLALEEAQKQVEVEKLGALVLYVFEDYPAYQSLEPGDVIVSVNGEAVEDAAAIGEIIGATPAGGEIELGVRGLDEEALAKAHEDDQGKLPDTSQILTEEKQVKVGTVFEAERGKPVIGVVTRDYFSYTSSIQAEWTLESVKGPSAGLMMTLSLFNRLTPDDLTGGREIAGTGEIFLDGKVGAIGGLPMKIKAAQREGAEVFIYPLDNQEDLAGVSTSLQLYAVDNLGEALEVLGN